MIAFKVRLNDQPLAGAEDLSALSAHITAAIHGGPPEYLSCWLQVGGLSRDDADRQGEHRTWVTRRRPGRREMSEGGRVQTRHGAACPLTCSRSCGHEW